MATHSSILAWRIPGTEELNGLPSMGSHSRTQLKQLKSSSSRLTAYRGHIGSDKDPRIYEHHEGKQQTAVHLR